VVSLNDLRSFFPDFQSPQDQELRKTIEPGSSPPPKTTPTPFNPEEPQLQTRQATPVTEGSIRTGSDGSSSQYAQQQEDKIRQMEAKMGEMEDKIRRMEDTKRREEGLNRHETASRQEEEQQERPLESHKHEGKLSKCDEEATGAGECKRRGSPETEVGELHSSTPSVLLFTCSPAPHHDDPAVSGSTLPPLSWSQSDSTGSNSSPSTKSIAIHPLMANPIPKCPADLDMAGTVVQERMEELAEKHSNAMSPIQSLAVVLYLLYHSALECERQVRLWTAGLHIHVHDVRH